MKGKNIFYTALLFVFATIIGCGKESELDSDTKADNEIIELKADFDAEEFKSAIIGKWQSVFLYPEEENVITLELDEKGKAKITLDKNNTSSSYEGNYAIEFIRPPMEGYVTLATITISANNREIILSRLNFGNHSGIPLYFGIVLRIEKSPYGVLYKIGSLNN